MSSNSTQQEKHHVWLLIHSCQRCQICKVANYQWRQPQLKDLHSIDFLITHIHLLSLVCQLVWNQVKYLYKFVFFPCKDTLPHLLLLFLAGIGEFLNDCRNCSRMLCNLLNNRLSAVLKDRLICWQILSNFIPDLYCRMHIQHHIVLGSWLEKLSLVFTNRHHLVFLSIPQLLRLGK